MSRLNKRALYQMAATRNSNSTQSETSAELNSNGVRFQPVVSTSTIPDGRVTGKLTESVLRKVKANDAISVSHRARRNATNPVLDVKRSEVLQKLGTGSLGLLTNAYHEQTLMTDNEFHSVQARFYGLENV